MIGAGEGYQWVESERETDDQRELTPTEEEWGIDTSEFSASDMQRAIVESTNDFARRTVEYEVDYGADALDWLEAMTELIDEGENPAEMIDVNQFKSLLERWTSDNPFRSSYNAPNHLDLGECETVEPFSEATEGAGGITEGSMFVGERDDGSRLFITRVSDDRRMRDRAARIATGFQSTQESAEQAMLGFHTMRNMGITVPDHHSEYDDYYSVEEAPGKPAKEFDPSEPIVDTDDFLDFAAVCMLTGQRDMHRSNVFLDDGEIVPIDLDLAGFDFGEHTDDAEWGLDNLTGVADHMGLYESGYRQPSVFDGQDDAAIAISARARSMAEEIDTEALLDGADEYTDVYENVEHSVEAVREGTAEWLADQSELSDYGIRAKAGEGWGEYAGIDVYRLGSGLEYERIGRIEDGAIVTSEDTIARSIPDRYLDRPDRLIAAFDGPYIVAVGERVSEAVERSGTKATLLDGALGVLDKKWVRYEGPNTARVGNILEPVRCDTWPRNPRRNWWTTPGRPNPIRKAADGYRVSVHAHRAVEGWTTDPTTPLGTQRAERRANRTA